MPKLTGNFDAAGEESRELLVRAGQSYVLSLTPDPSLTGSIQLLARDDSPAASSVIRTFTDTLALTEYKNETGKDQYLRLRCVDLDETEPEDVDYVLQSLISTGTRKLALGTPKVGATAGWTVNGATNVGTLALLPAAQTGSTLVVPLDFLSVGDVITGFYPVGQVESAGNNATLTVNLRKITAAAADVVDASVATSGAITFAADTLLGRITLPVENVNATVADGESYYFLITGTTAAATDVALQGMMVALA
jgi:hypothetical protein